MPPLSVLARYLQEVEVALEQAQGVVIDAYVEELLTPARANLRIRLRFDNGRLLEINEALVVEQGALQHLDYRYHCQDRDNRLVFRYDSTPHFPDLPGFPFHKHLPDDTLPAERPTIAAVLAEAAETKDDVEC
ncbi:toxin TumE [Allochromatium palmeri]|uniref:Uncharacterized protein n=1 Tax=Allochromatium palmeri TaxID=231048 RepID=A0A6N8EF79_9GAMM|nr:DUF6516 family protein [Allochromatium palmeri]MTW22883.1 hypothetical protein [Allochromatium palmeri]